LPLEIQKTAFVQIILRYGGAPLLYWLTRNCFGIIDTNDKTAKTATIAQKYPA